MIGELHPNQWASSISELCENLQRADIELRDSQREMPDIDQQRTLEASHHLGRAIRSLRDGLKAILVWRQKPFHWFALVTGRALAGIGAARTQA